MNNTDPVVYGVNYHRDHPAPTRSSHYGDEDQVLPDHGWDPTAGHHAPFESDADQAAAVRKFWATEHLWDHVF